MALAFNKFNVLVEDLAEKAHNFQTDTLKLMLTNTAPSAANLMGDIVEIGAGNGYTAGGVTVPVASSTQTGGVYKLTLGTPPAWAAAGGPIAAFRYFVLYNATANRPICWYDYGSVVNMAAGEQFQASFDATNGVLTIQ